jgi:integrase
MFGIASQCSDMSEQKTSQTSSHAGSRATTNPNKPEHPATLHYAKSGKRVANERSGGVGKNSANYWIGRLFKPVNSDGAESPHFSMKVQYKGRRVAFTLGTSNKTAAAAKAASIYNHLLTHGVEGTLAKHRPQTAGDHIATIGEYLAAANAVMDVRDATFGAYGVNLRRIAGDILRSRTQRKDKVKAKRVAREKIEQASLSILTPEAVQKWRLAFVARVAGDARKARAARISANSIVRQARSLFAPKVVKFLKTLRLPDPLPFAGVEMFPRESMRYISKIDAGQILRKAHDELAEKAPEQFLAILLAAVVGLRRGEIDRLQWDHVDFGKKQIFVEDTEQGALKSSDSRGAVDIDETAIELLRGFKAKAKKAGSDFIIDAPQADEAEFSRPWGLRYRCSAVFEKVNAWLRVSGVDGNKPLHTLRKEAGSIIATQHGIFAAAQFLRHSDIKVTAEHYADKKTRTAIDLGKLLDVGADAPDNVVKISEDKPEAKKPQAKGKRATR